MLIISNQFKYSTSLKSQNRILIFINTRSSTYFQDKSAFLQNLQLQLNMGKQSSKIKDILFVTGADLDPPEVKIQKKSNPTKDPKIDYRVFKPKKYYKKDATDEQIEQHMKKLKSKEDILKHFKYYKDFDRINLKEMQLNVATFEIYVEQAIKLGLISAVITSRIIQMQLINEYYTMSGWFRLILPCFFTIMPIFIHRAITSQQYHIANHEYFRLVDDQTAQYQQFDLELNMYKDVQDMKYNFKYPKVRDFYKTKREVMDRGELAFKGLYREYFQYYNQLKFDKYEQFVKERQKQRKGSQDLINSNDMQEIKANLEKKPAVI